MKKIYSIPTIEIEDMETQEMLAVSDPNVILNPDGSVDAEKVGGRFGIFDEDEDEE